MADRGAPIVAKIAGKWAVVSGNGRKIAFDRLARGTHANWDNYRRYWAAHATEVGIDPEAVAANPGGFLARVRPARRDQPANQVLFRRVIFGRF
jgi:hypothetical protein